MTESSESRGYGNRIVRALVIFFIAISVAAAIGLISAEGFTPAVVAEVVVTLYVSAIVFYAVFFDAVDSRRFRLALYAGVVLWGGQRYVAGDQSILTVALILGGLGLAVRELYFSD
ncbi:MAG: hypothetical protein ACOC0Z_04020 [Halohasta sp.]